MPGWFPLVADPLHARLYRGKQIRTVEVVGARMRLDLDEYTQRRIYYNAFERDEIRFARRFLRPGDVFFDVGAHVGLFSLVAARAVGPTGAVHAFEPSNVNAAQLRANIDLNGLRNVSIVDAAVGDEPGCVMIGHAGLTGSSGQFTIGGVGNTRPVRVVTLDDYAADHAVTDIRLVKIDVEGYEAHVFRGAARLLDDQAPDAILFEVNKRMLERHGSSARELAELLRSRSYRLVALSRGRGERQLAEDLFADPLPDVGRPRMLATLRTGVAERHLLFNVLAVSPVARGS